MSYGGWPTLSFGNVEQGETELRSAVLDFWFTSL
jgi:hypothetical protein